MNNEEWIALMIGNSRLHWAWFQGEKLCQTWDSCHLDHEISRLPEAIFPQSYREKLSDSLPVYLASVVAQQNHLWDKYPHAYWLPVREIPVTGVYATIGSDRLLTLWGGGSEYGFPCLVIDGGSALTLTGASAHKQLIGGAIIPGIRLQLQALATKTAALPDITLPSNLPSRWALTTEEAIASGIIYSMIATIKDFLEDWWLKFPHAPVIFTGGDGKILYNHLCSLFPQFQIKLTLDSLLIFKGIKALKYRKISDNQAN
jgi:type III pantothenate kinase